MRRPVAVLVSLCLASCTSIGPSRVDSSAAHTFNVPRPAGAPGPSLAAANQAVLERALEEVLNYCLPRLSGYEIKSAEQAQWAFWLAMSGLLAGAVAVPALTAAAAQANAAWIASLGGWAGATNFAGQVLRTSGLSGATIAETRNSIIKDVKSQIAIAMDGERSFEERRSALLQARASCVLYEISVPTVPPPSP